MNKALVPLFMVAVLLGCSGSKDEVQYRGQSLRQWIRLLQGPGEGQLMTLEEFRKSTPEEARAILPELRILLQAPEEDIRLGALTLLGELGRNAEEAVPLIIETLKDPAADIRRSAAMALLPMGTTARQAIPALLTALGDPESRVRMSAVSTLGQMKDTAVVPAIAACLKDENEFVRRHVARTLRDMGAMAKEAHPALQAALTDSDPRVREYAAEALELLQAGPQSNDGS
jgi:HEAT repeat protein